MRFLTSWCVRILMFSTCALKARCGSFSIDIAPGTENSAHMRILKCQEGLGVGPVTKIDFWIVLRNETEFDAIIEPEESPTGYYDLHFQLKCKDGSVKNVSKRNVDFHYIPEMKPICIKQGSSVCLGVAFRPEIWDGADCNLSRIQEIRAIYTGVLFLWEGSLYASPADIRAGKVFVRTDSASLPKYKSPWREAAFLAGGSDALEFPWFPDTKRKQPPAFDFHPNDDIIVKDLL